MAKLIAFWEHALSRRHSRYLNHLDQSNSRFRDPMQILFACKILEEYQRKGYPENVVPFRLFVSEEFGFTLVCPHCGNEFDGPPFTPRPAA